MKERGEIELNTGRIITLRELHQTLTYAGLLEGTPTSAMNAHHVQSIVQAQLNTALGGAVHLIEPVEVPIQRGAIPTRTYARIPLITCVGMFESEPARVRLCASALVIIWFQESFGPPIDIAVLTEIKRTPWEALACDFDI